MVIDLKTVSLPSPTLAARQRPMVPVPQQTSTSVVFSSSEAMSPASWYRVSAARVFTWEIILLNYCVQQNLISFGLIMFTQSKNIQI